MRGVTKQLGWRDNRLGRNGGDERRTIPFVAKRLGAKPIGAAAAPYVISFMVATYAAVFVYLSILSQDAFQTHAFDMGNMDQAVWNTMQGRWFHFTNWGGGTSRLAAHVEPVLLLVAQLYRLADTPNTLLVLQSLVIALGALPTYWLALDKLKNHLAALAFGAAYLLMPAVQSANLFEFHAVSLSASFLLYAFYFAYKRSYTLFFIAALLAMGTKEQVPVAVALMGLYILITQRNRRVGVITIFTALTWFFVSVQLIIPAYNSEGVSPYVSRYDSLGKTPGQILMAFFTNPGKLIGMLFQPTKLDYIRTLLAPTAYLALLSPLTLVMAVPDLAINIFSNFPTMYGGSAHYGAVIAPFVVISAIYGAALLMNLVRLGVPQLAQPAAVVLSATVFLSSANSSAHEVFLPLADHFPQVTLHQHRAQEIIARIPPSAGVSASSVLNPHVSHRERLYLFPDVKDADYVFLDVTSSPYPSDYGDVRWRVQQMLDDDWGIVTAQDGYLLLQEDAPDRELPRDFFDFARAQDYEISHPLSVRFGSNLYLRGYDLEPGTLVRGRDPVVHLRLYWQLTKPTTTDYSFTAYLIDSTGAPISRQTDNPTSLWYPTSVWRRGEIVRMSSIQLPLYNYSQALLALSVSPGPEEDDAMRVLPESMDSGSAVQVSRDNLLLLTQVRAQH
ncbi:MAG: DUF2079 domain-containing protein [Chloroflexota bacterium]|nr:MAG: DUF2079 domain-containing protein [Chloroflexota bacterium]